MIFVSVGTTKFPFDRLLESVDKVLLTLRSKEKLIVQRGSSQYQFKYPYTKVAREISFLKMIFRLKEARISILQGGPATIFLALKYCQNQPLVIPRVGEFGEHVNDHQLYFSKFLDKRRMAKVILPEDNLTGKIAKYLQNPVKITKKLQLKPEKRLIDNLVNYTERNKLCF